MQILLLIDCLQIIMKKVSKQNITTASINSITVPTAATTATHSVTAITATAAILCMYLSLSL